MAETTLVIAAHADDEALGCGGTIARMVRTGRAVSVAFFTDGVSARKQDGRELSSVGDFSADERRLAAKRAADILGVASVAFDDLPDNRLDTIPLLEIAKRVEILVERHQPATILTHHRGDLNIDHRRVHDAVVTACRPQRGHPVRTILAFEVPSSTEWQSPAAGDVFTPNWFVDIGDTLGTKLDAIDAYAREMRPWPHPRSRQGVEHLARWRGATVGCDAAEAFMLIRHSQ